MSYKSVPTNNGHSPSKSPINESTKPYEVQDRRIPKKFNFWRGIYNKDKNFYLGRTPRNWAGILTFYAIFYIILAALFAICMQALFASLSDTEPTWLLDESRIGSNPGLGVRPRSDNIQHGSIIWYDAKDKDQINKWGKLLNDFLTPYSEDQKINGNRNQVQCDFGMPTQPGKVCSVDVTKFGECNPENGFGYNKSSPCVFLKLNRIYNWVPDFYDDPATLPDDMPDDLKLYIAAQKPAERKQVWVSCRGENSADEEAIGPIQFIPRRGFPGYYYPYRNEDGYMSPLIALQFERPTLHRIINIECRAWAKNIFYKQSFVNRQGSVHFELMID